MFFQKKRKKKRSPRQICLVREPGSAAAGNSLAPVRCATSIHASQSLTVSIAFSSPFVLDDNDARGAAKSVSHGEKPESEVPAQTCSAELSLSLHNILPGCFHFIGSARRTHSSTIPPPLFPPPPPPPPPSSPPFLCFILNLDATVPSGRLPPFLFTDSLLRSHTFEPPLPSFPILFLLPSSSDTLSCRLQPSLKHQILTLP